MKYSICKGCGKKLLPDEKYKFSNKIYCIDCYNFLKKEDNARRDLIEYICDIFDTDAPNTLSLKQIKDMREQYGYTYGGIQYTLWYIAEVLNMDMDKKYGIAMVKYKYEEAREFCMKQLQIENKLEQLSDNPVEIHKVKYTPTENNILGLIDLSEFTKGG